MQTRSTRELASEVVFAPFGPFAVGETIADSYRIDAVLGSGGMGIVYEAQDVNLPRRVAVKVARAPAFEAAIRTEAQALSALRHPSFPTVYQYGCHDGTAFLVMERIYGEPLSERLASFEAGAFMPLDVVVDTVLAIARALAAAHQVTVAHRDVKAANVLLCGDRIVLFDLGLFVPEVLVSAQDLPAGSADSIAPEVIQSCVKRGGGPFIDLYALGALMFELLTGVPPYCADSLEALLAQHVMAPIPDPTTLRPGVPRPLCDIVHDLLAKEPRNRPPSAEVVIARLEAQRARRRRRSVG